MMATQASAAAIVLLGVFGAGAARADPCTLIPERGRAPAEVAAGRPFSGPVAHVIDGDGLCVALGPDPSRRAEVRLQDFYAPELGSAAGKAAKAALGRIVLGRRVVCRAGRQSYDRVVALCTLDGVPLGDLMRRAGVSEGGRGLR